MTDTASNLKLNDNVWVDLYAESGIQVGAQISVENVGVSDVYLTTQATQPPINHDAYVICKRYSLPYSNDAGDSGAWAFVQTQALK